MHKLSFYHKLSLLSSVVVQQNFVVQQVIHSEPKKNQDTIVLSVTWPNVYRFSKFFTVKDSTVNMHTHTQPFNGLLSGTTRVGRYQKKNSPTHTHPDHRTSFIIFLHLQRSMASSLFSLRA